MAFKAVRRTRRRPFRRGKKPNKVFAKKVNQVLDRRLEMMTTDGPIVYTEGTTAEVMAITFSGLYKDGTLNAVNGTGIFRCVPLSVGTTLGTRIGNTVSLKKLEMRLYFYLSNNYPFSHCNIRWFLFKRNPDGEQTPPQNLLYDAPFINTANVIWAPHNIRLKSQYKMIKSGLVHLENTYDANAIHVTGGMSERVIVKTFKFKDLNMSWNNSLDGIAGAGTWNNSDYCNKNHLYFAAYSEDPPLAVTATTPQLKGLFRAYYHTD